MRQGITTRYLGPTNTKGSRYKAIARKADQWGKEMSLTDHANHAEGLAANHARVAKLLAAKLGWSGLWICGGKPEDDGYMFVCLDVSPPLAFTLDTRWGKEMGKKDEDWFYVEPAKVEA